MLRVILNKFRKLHLTKLQLYGHLPPIKLDETDMLDTAAEVGTNSYVTYSCGPLHMDDHRLDEQLEPTYHSSVPIQSVSPEAMDDREGWQERSGISMLMAQHVDGDDDDNAPVRFISNYAAWTPQNKEKQSCKNRILRGCSN